MTSDAFDKLSQRIRGEIDPRPSQATVTGADPSLSVQGGGNVVPPVPPNYTPWELQIAGGELPYVVFYETHKKFSIRLLHLFGGCEVITLDEGGMTFLASYTEATVQITGQHINELPFLLSGARVSRVWAHDPHRWEKPAAGQPIITEIQVKMPQ